MATVHTFSLRNGEMILQELKVLCGRDLISEIVRNALYNYRDSITSSGREICPLPSWRTFKNKLLDTNSMDDIQELKKDLTQLLNITNSIIEYKKGVTKIEF